MFHTIFSFALVVLSADSQKICYAIIQESKQENVCALYPMYSRMYANVYDSINLKPFLNLKQIYWDLPAIFKQSMNFYQK